MQKTTDVGVVVKLAKPVAVFGGRSLLDRLQPTAELVELG